MPVDLSPRPTPRDEIVVYPLGLDDVGVDAFVTTRAGGVSEGPYASLNLGEHVGDDPARVAENRRRVARAAGVDPGDLVTVRQVHGTDLAEVRAGGPRPLEADGLVTEDPEVAVAVLSADCVPLVLVDPDRGRIAVVHAGWRGLAAGMIERAVASLAPATRLEVAVGPAIAGAAYQVGPEVAAHFAEVPGAVRPDVGDRSRLDLVTVVHHRLLACGVADGSLRILRASTDADPTLFSDRAERPCGRQALVARRRTMGPS